MTDYIMSLTINDFGRIKRKHKPTRDEALWFASIWGPASWSRAIRKQLTTLERIAGIQQEHLIRRQAWERKTFGRVLSTVFDQTMRLPDSALTT
jgi:hypothetical protein